MDGGAWWAAVHGVTKSQTRQSNFTHFSLSCLGEGNGNPLQCSCLENPRDGGAWLAAVSGVAESRTRLKRLSSSSSSIRVYTQIKRLTQVPSSHCNSSCIKFQFLLLFVSILLIILEMADSYRESNIYLIPATCRYLIFPLLWQTVRLLLLSSLRHVSPSS